MRSGSTAVFMAVVLSSISSQILNARNEGALTVGFAHAGRDSCPLTMSRRRVVARLKTRRTDHSAGSGVAVRQGFEPWVQVLSPYNGLANRRLQPLGHLTAHPQVYVRRRRFIA